jgi:hypothetical protein
MKAIITVNRNEIKYTSQHVKVQRFSAKLLLNV